MIDVILPEPMAFEWDDANKDKNKKHGVTNEEAEESFFDPNKKVFSDMHHSRQEQRFILIGATRHCRPLFIVFTFRKQRVRIISARHLNRKEHPLYL